MPGALPFLKGTMDILVLKALAWTPMHGFELARWLEERSGGAFGIDEAAVYQSLYRMEANKLVAAEWGRSETGHRARYYQLTRAGRKQLQAREEHWTRYVEAVFKILRSTESKPA